MVWGRREGHDQTYAISLKGLGVVAPRGRAICGDEALCEAKGFTPLGQFFDEDVRMRAFVGAPAAIGLSHRPCLGNTRSIGTDEIRMQGALDLR